MSTTTSILSTIMKFITSPDIHLVLGSISILSMAIAVWDHADFDHLPKQLWYSSTTFVTNNNAFFMSTIPVFIDSILDLCIWLRSLCIHKSTFTTPKHSFGRILMAITAFMASIQFSTVRSSPSIFGFTIHGSVSFVFTLLSLEITIICCILFTLNCVNPIIFSTSKTIFMSLFTCLFTTLRFYSMIQHGHSHYSFIGIVTLIFLCICAVVIVYWTYQVISSYKLSVIANYTCLVNLFMLFLVITATYLPIMRNFNSGNYFTAYDILDCTTIPLANIISILTILIVTLTIIPGRIARYEAVLHLQQIIDMKTAYVRFISHELRTPLNSVFLGLNLSINQIPEHTECEEEKERRDTLMEIASACSAALDILNQLLLFDKLQSGILLANKMKTRVSELIHESIKMFAVQIREKNITFTITNHASDLFMDPTCLTFTPKTSTSTSNPSPYYDNNSLPSSTSQSLTSYPYTSENKGISSPIDSSKSLIYTKDSKQRSTSIWDTFIMNSSFQPAAALSSSSSSINGVHDNYDLSHIYEKHDTINTANTTNTKKDHVYQHNEIHTQQHSTTTHGGCLGYILEEDEIDVDKAKLIQVIRNFVSNAIKFTPEGGHIRLNMRFESSSTHPINEDYNNVYPAKTVDTCDVYDLSESGNNSPRISPRSKISFFNRPDINGYLVIEVTDTGAGISEENQLKLFREIVQFKPEILQNGGGSGLGMWISKGIVDLHEGMISVYSAGEGHGSTFTLKIPMIRSLSIETPVTRMPLISHLIQDHIIRQDHHHHHHDYSPHTQQDITTTSSFHIYTYTLKSPESHSDHSSSSSHDPDANSSSSSSTPHSGASESKHNELQDRTTRDGMNIIGCGSGSRGSNHVRDYSPTTTTTTRILSSHKVPLRVHMTSNLSLSDNISLSDNNTCTENLIGDERLKPSSPHINTPKGTLTVVDHTLNDISSSSGGLYIDENIIENNDGDSRVVDSKHSNCLSSSSIDPLSTMTLAATCKSPSCPSSTLSQPLNEPITRKTTTTATTTVPMSPTICASPPSTPSTIMTSKKLYVLVVDDSSMNRKMLCRLLKAHGHKCDEAYDGVHAVKTIRKKISTCTLSSSSDDNELMITCGGNSSKSLSPYLSSTSSKSNVLNRSVDYFEQDDPIYTTTSSKSLMPPISPASPKTSTNNTPEIMYDIIFMDFMMPNMDGPTATAEIRKLGYTGPIIGATGNALQADIDYFIEKGATQVLIKPLDSKLVLSTLPSI